MLDKRLEDSQNKRAKLETESVKKAVDAVNSKKDIGEKLFDIRFRPSFDKEEYMSQREAYKAIKDIKEEIKGATSEQKIILKENGEKLAKMSKYFKEIENANLSEKEIQIKQNEVVSDFITQENIVRGNVGKKGPYEPFKNERMNDVLENRFLASQLALEFDTGREEKIQQPIEPNDNKLEKKQEINK
jgi:hypothetical protein